MEILVNCRKSSWKNSFPTIEPLSYCYYSFLDTASHFAWLSNPWYSETWKCQEKIGVYFVVFSPTANLTTWITNLEWSTCQGNQKEYFIWWCYSILLKYNMYTRISVQLSMWKRRVKKLALVFDAEQACCESYPEFLLYLLSYSHIRCKCVLSIAHILIHRDWFGRTFRVARTIYGWHPHSYLAILIAHLLSPSCCSYWGRTSK